MEESRVSNYMSSIALSSLKSLRYRDDWGIRHFLHPKLLRKAREVRVQLEDIMKFRRMELISTGTDFDVLRYVTTYPLFFLNVISVLPLGKRLLQDIFIKQPGSKVSVNLSTSGLGFLHTCTQRVLYMA